MRTEIIKFHASFANIRSGVSLNGQGNGARIRLDIPRDSIDAVVKLFHKFAGKSFVMAAWSEEEELVIAEAREQLSAT